MKGTNIAPWLSVSDGAKGADFYKRGFGAKEVYRLGEGESVIICQLAIDGALFWIQEDPSSSPEVLGKGSVRMILTVDNPDEMLANAVAAGANVIAPIYEEHGWRIGRIEDPFGHQWEIGKQI
ncbi:VOC family protein [Lederbergia wuyishanensis]|uniref:PhnB protein n=1 Tax=Lederbergia wuyishanensis TaxID=1347903 RepID=A0ABU0D521_9BACI|nr:VOC family protein [Lederbergia wuyishanensis]MCJ8009594.1 VOC family protein [Lederbergia wuyishanensis]MDQ0343500.1 PhnB protein [Lederbergia wuyishanensis]